MRTASRRTRAGRTDKISVSVEREDLAMMRRRAKRLYGGNLSAVIGEGIRRVREEEGREALVRWLGDAGSATPEQREALRAEWGFDRLPERRTVRRRK